MKVGKGNGDGEDKVTDGRVSDAVCGTCYIVAPWDKSCSCVY